MNFFCLKESREADMSKTGRKVNMTIKTELDAENDRELDGVIDKAVVFEFTDMSSYVAGITFFLNKPVYIINVKEKGRATEPLCDIYGNNISTGELYLRENYPKMAASKKIRGHTEAVARRCSVKKDVLRNSAKFTGKHLSQSLFFNKAAT